MKDLKIYMLVIWALLAMSCQKETVDDDGIVRLRVSLSAEEISRAGYNVITGMVSGNPVAVTRTLSAVSSGDYFAADYVFVPGGEEALDITLTVGEHVQDMRGITVKTNMVTRIQGDFIK